MLFGCFSVFLLTFLFKGYFYESLAGLTSPKSSSSEVKTDFFFPVSVLVFYCFVTCCNKFTASKSTHLLAPFLVAQKFGMAWLHSQIRS